MTAGAVRRRGSGGSADSLLLASTINYMDRQTLANAATRISHEFGFKQEQYGNLEFGFGLAFAVGSLLFGFAVDRIRVRWLYPTVLLLWSGVGSPPASSNRMAACSSAGRCSASLRAVIGRARSRPPSNCWRHRTAPWATGSPKRHLDQRS